MVSTRRNYDSGKVKKEDGDKETRTPYANDTGTDKVGEENEANGSRRMSRHSAKLNSSRRKGRGVVVARYHESELASNGSCSVESQRQGTRHSRRLRNRSRTSLNESFLEYQNECGMYGEVLYQNGIDEVTTKGKRKSEVRDLLAAQGKELDDGNLDEEPDIYSSVKSRVRVSTSSKLYSDFLTSVTTRKKEQQQEEEEGSQSEVSDEECSQEEGAS